MYIYFMKTSGRKFQIYKSLRSDFQRNDKNCVQEKIRVYVK